MIDRKHQRYTRAELQELPVLAIGQADDLLIDADGIRVWLSRDPPYVVEIEHWIPESGWSTIERYMAD